MLVGCTLMKSTGDVLLLPAITGLQQENCYSLTSRGTFLYYFVTRCGWMQHVLLLVVFHTISIWFSTKPILTIIVVRFMLRQLFKFMCNSPTTAPNPMKYAMFMREHVWARLEHNAKHFGHFITVIAILIMHTILPQKYQALVVGSISATGSRRAARHGINFNICKTQFILSKHLCVGWYERVTRASVHGCPLYSSILPCVLGSTLPPTAHVSVINSLDCIFYCNALPWRRCADGLQTTDAKCV